MNKKQKKLKKLSKGKSDWKDEAEFRIRNQIWLGYSSNIARRILAAIQDKGNITQRKLAAAINVSPQYICKVVKGKENLSLETIAKLSDALNVELITFPSYKYSPVITSYNSTIIMGMKGFAIAVHGDNVNLTQLQEFFSGGSDIALISQKEIQNNLLPLIDNTPETKLLDNGNYSLIKQQ